MFGGLKKLSYYEKGAWMTLCPRRISHWSQCVNTGAMPMVCLIGPVHLSWLVNTVWPHPSDCSEGTNKHLLRTKWVWKRLRLQGAGRKEMHSLLPRNLNSEQMHLLKKILTEWPSVGIGKIAKMWIGACHSMGQNSSKLPISHSINTSSLLGPPCPSPLRPFWCHPPPT